VRFWQIHLSRLVLHFLNAKLSLLATLTLQLRESPKWDPRSPSAKLQDAA
jgi:hypothetical protein